MNEDKRIPVYKNTNEKKPLLSTLIGGCVTPALEVKYCTLLRPFFYPNSPRIPRYSITCLVDPVLHKDFIAQIRHYEESESVQSTFKPEYAKSKGKSEESGLLLIKFQTKEGFDKYVVENDGKPEEMELEDEIAKGEKVIVNYDILRYTKKNTTATEHGLSFKLNSVTLLSNEA